MRECNLNELFIEQYLDGELGYRESAEIAAHIKECERCRVLYEQYRDIRRAAKQWNDEGALSGFEKDALMLFIDTNSRPWYRQFIKRVRFITESHGFTVGFSTAAILLLLTIFTWKITTIDSRYNLVLHDITVADSSNLPPEFEGKDSVLTMHHKMLHGGDREMKRILRHVSNVRGRLVTVGERPALALRLYDNSSNGTLLVSDDNGALRHLFESGACAAGDCKVRTKTIDGKNMLYWNRDSRDYLFIGDRSPLRDKMVHLVSY